MFFRIWFDLQANLRKVLKNENLKRQSELGKNISLLFVTQCLHNHYLMNLVRFLRLPSEL